MWYFHTRKFFVECWVVWLYNRGLPQRITADGTAKKIKNFLQTLKNWCIISSLAQQILGTLAY
jgi:hypothetical protein